MKLLGCFLYILVSCVACSKVANVFSPSVNDQHYGVTALLNDSAWFGSTFAQRAYIIEGKDCTFNQFALGLSTDLPHAKSGTEPIKGITGCTEQCVPTQHLGFQRIPLAVGQYKLAAIKNWVEDNILHSAVDYTWIIGGDMAINHFYPRGTTIRNSRRIFVDIPGNDNSWIKVTHYNPKTGQLEGAFEITLVSRKGEIAHFTKGAFKVTLTR